MSRAELRRKQREEKKSTKVYQMTDKQIQAMKKKIYQEVRESVLGETKELSEQIFKMMLAVPTNVLINDYWEKTAEKRIPKFVDDCLSLFNSLENGTVTMEELQDLTERYAKIKLLDVDSMTERTLKKYKI